MTGFTAAIGSISGVSTAYPQGLYARQYNGYFYGNVSWFAGNTPISQGVDPGPLNESAFTATSWQWLGYILAPSTGTYSFSTLSSDISYVWVGPTALDGAFTISNALINNPGYGTTVSATRSLSGAVLTPIRIQWGFAEDLFGVGQLIFSMNGSSNLKSKIFYNPATNGL